MGEAVGHDGVKMETTVLEQQQQKTWKKKTKKKKSLCLYLIGLLQGINELTLEKHLEHALAQHQANVSDG